MCSVPRCFVPGCKTGYPSDRKLCKQEGRKCLNLFCVPRDEKILEKWKLAIPQSYREFSWTDTICEKHFHEDDLDRYYIKTLPDGTSHVLERKRAKLKSSAVPSIFPKSSECRKTSEKKPMAKKFLKETLPADDIFTVITPHEQTDDQVIFPCGQEIIDKKTSPIDVVSTETSFEQMNDDPVTFSDDLTFSNEEVSPADNISTTTSYEQMDNYSVSTLQNETTSQDESSICQNDVRETELVEGTYLSECLKFVKLQSGWSIHATANNYIVCAKWLSTLETAKKIIIKNDLSVKVFVNDIEIKKNFGKINSVGDVSSLVKEVHKYTSCQKFQGNKNCLGMLPDHDIRKEWQSRNRCHSCQQLYRNMKKMKRKCKSDNKLFREQKLYERIAEERKKYAAIRNEINELKKKLKSERTVNKELAKLDELFLC